MAWKAAIGMRALYFGVEDPRHLGHFMYEAAPEGRRPGMYSLGGRDGSVTPWGWHTDGNLAPRPRGRYSEAPQGHAALHHKDGWTALSFWDRSGDSRGASNSTFLFDATLDFDTALAAAKERFPFLFERFDFEVVPYTASPPQNQPEHTPGEHGRRHRDA